MLPVLARGDGSLIAGDFLLGYGLNQLGLRHDVLTGGDDYELLFAAPPSCRDAVIEAAAGADTAVKRIGRVEAGRGVRVLDPDGRAVDGLDRGGWDHF